MKKILVPCDFSEPAIEAYKTALDIAAKSKGSVTVLHVIYISAVHDPNFMGEPMAYTAQLFSMMEEDAKKAFARMQHQSKNNTKVTLEISVGGLLESINRFVEEKQFDLVVMGTSGSSGIEEILVGSNTEKAVRFCKVPVLTVRKAFDTDSVRNILLPTTGDLNQLEFISKVKEMQAFLKARLHVLFINTPAHFQRDEEGHEILKEFVKHYHITDCELYFRNYREEEEGIIDFAHANQMDLIAMATHSRRGLAHLFSGSVTENVVNRIPKPVWTYSIRKSL